MNSMTNKLGEPAVLLLGNYRPTMPVAKTFKNRGFKVIASLAGCDRGAEYCRYVDEIWDHPPLLERTQRFTDALNTFLLRNPNIETIVPVAEEYVRLFSTVGLELSRPVNILTNRKDTVTLCLDKVKLLTKASSIGLPVAPFILVDCLDRILDAGKAFGYPLVIRPEQSTNRLLGKKAITVNNANEVVDQLTQWPIGHENLLVQRKVQGIRHNIYFAARRGSIERYLHSKILRTDRQDGSGLAVEGLTIKPDPALMKFSKTLIADLKYSGIGCVQYLVDEQVGDIHFLEINPRIAGNHVLPEYCQLGLSDWFIENTIDPANSSSDERFGSTGVRYSWLAGDLQGLKIAWLQKEVSLPQATFWMFRALKTYFRSDLDIMINRNDPKPGIFALMEVIFGSKFKSMMQKYSNRSPRVAHKPTQPSRSTYL